MDASKLLTFQAYFNCVHNPFRHRDVVQYHPSRVMFWLITFILQVFVDFWLQFNGSHIRTPSNLFAESSKYTSDSVGLPIGRRNFEVRVSYLREYSNIPRNRAAGNSEHFSRTPTTRVFYGQSRLELLRLLSLCRLSSRKA